MRAASPGRSGCARPRGLPANRAASRVPRAFRALSGRRSARTRCAATGRCVRRGGSAGRAPGRRGPQAVQRRAYPGVRTRLPATPAHFIGCFFCITCTKARNRPSKAMDDVERASNYLQTLRQRDIWQGHQPPSGSQIRRHQEEAKTRRPTVSKKKTPTTYSVSGRL